MSDPCPGSTLSWRRLDVDWDIVWDVLLEARDFYLEPGEEQSSLFHSCTFTGSVVRGLRDGLAEHFTPRSSVRAGGHYPSHSLASRSSW